MSVSNDVIIAPSLLSADFAKLGEEVVDVEQAGANWLHLDIMDGIFVPNLTFGPLVLESLRQRTKLFLDVHLMVDRPEEKFGAFVKAGADALTVHFENTVHLHRALQQIRNLGIKAGVALNPGTPVSVLEPVLNDLDLILLMSVNPGFGGQSYLPLVEPKVEQLVRLRKQHKLAFFISVDGGIQAPQANRLRSLGADVLVAGTAIFKERDRRAAVEGLRGQ